MKKTHIVTIKTQKQYIIKLRHKKNASEFTSELGK